MKASTKSTLWNLASVPFMVVILNAGIAMGKREVHNEPIKEKIEQSDSLSEIKQLEAEKKSNTWPMVAYAIGIFISGTPICAMQELSSYTTIEWIIDSR